jgi:hypothetical protein
MAESREKQRQTHDMTGNCVFPQFRYMGETGEFCSGIVGQHIGKWFGPVYWFQKLLPSHFMGHNDLNHCMEWGSLFQDKPLRHWDTFIGKSFGHSL